MQVNLRWVVVLILLVVIVPTVVLTGIGIAVIFARDEALDLVFGILVTSFASSVIAGAVLLLVLAGRGARLARVQETFLSHMGHELLTPLAGIHLHSQILRGQQLPSEARRAVEAITRETDRLQSLVERTLQWRQIRASRHLYRREMTTLAEVVDRVETMLSRSAGLEISVRNGETRLIADRDALAEAVTNLVHNAFKYAGADGPVELVARMFAGRLIISVRDRGPGLPPGPWQQLFDPFYRHVPGDQPDPGGSGLGLTIAREIVRAHGGQLIARPRSGGGARFSIVLPARSAP
ncbi:MAG: HAMP domain-containing histidine kinase [Acidobacteriota bacterium]|nr:MAG: HAMP domain-containing histidine kinase [Acidobacteriota bacterium]